MGQIYASARETVVWLGEETEEVRHSFRLIEGVRSHYPEYILTEMSNTPHSVGMFLLTEDFNAERINSSYNWGPIQELLRRPWFQRKWVLLLPA
jgi:hypothetical protein